MGKAMSRLISVLLAAPLALGACAPPPAAPLVAGSPIAYSRPAGRASTPVAAPATSSVQGATAVVASPVATDGASETAPAVADTTPRFVAPATEVEVPSYQLPSNRPLR